VRIIDIKSLPEVVAVFKKIGVDPYGIEAMKNKAANINIILDKQQCKVANIIKQEMLSIGGDAAVARGSVACSVESTDILIMGTRKQILALSGKIRNQPFGLSKISSDLLELVNNLNTEDYVFQTSRRKIKLENKTLIMGILNVTPDSFSDGGLFYDQKKAVERGFQIQEEGADIIDIGGESTRPGSQTVPVDAEIKRVVPVIDALVKKIKVPISIDTKKSKVAKAAIEAGAEIINDISALNLDKNMAKIAADTGAGLILMHMRGTPKNMQKGDLLYRDLMGEIIIHLQKAIDKAKNAGVKKESIVVDPGVGFGKTPEDNYKIIKYLRELKTLGMPVMIGTSRKSFIGKLTGGKPEERQEGTAASVTASILNGCNIIRVHDVAAMKKVVAVADAVLRA
jgi:dihydropteroate synthase